MLLSISSSSRGRAAAVLPAVAATAALTFGLYALLIALWAPDVRSGQDQESNNAIAVERFLYGPLPVAVIVGSSQAQRIPSSALGPETLNMALAGHGPLDGLAIIARSGRLPRRIYIEMNNVGHTTDAAFVDSFLAEPGYTAKRVVAALRTTYQPSNLVVSELRRAARGRDDVYYPHAADRETHDVLIAQQQRLLAVPPDLAPIEHNLAETKRLAGILAARGAELVLFEMPIEPLLEQTPAIVAVRRALHAAFISGDACWNDDAAPRGLPSTDGNHLGSDDAAVFWAGLSKTECGRAPVASGQAPPN